MSSSDHEPVWIELKDELTRYRSIIFVVAVLERKTGLQNDLEMMDLAILYVTARLYDFKPAQIPKRFSSAPYCHAYGVFDAVGRRSHKLYDLIDMFLFHHDSSGLPAISVAGLREEKRQDKGRGDSVTQP